MFYVLRNKLPRLAASKLSSTAPYRSERFSSGSDSEDDGDLPGALHHPVSSALWSAATDRTYLRLGHRTDGRAYVNGRSNPSWQDAEKGRHQLMSAADYFSRHCGGMEHVLVMNLGDPWKDPSQLQLFDNRVVDIPSSGKHSAPGSDVIPLDILFTICSSMHSWLHINDKNVTFLHANNSAGSTGEESLKFVVGCYLAYLGDSDTTTQQHKSDETHWKVNNKAFVTPQEPASDVSQVMYSIGIDTNKINNYGGPARRRYAQYFLSILYTPNPPPSQDLPLAIDNVIITGLDEIRTNLRVTRLLSQRWKDSLLHPVLVIYQRGKLKWKQVVPSKDSKIEIQPEVDVRGDCVVGLWFVKDCISTNDPPVVAFSFHSAFMEAGVVRLSCGDLTCLGMDMRQILDNPACNVSMELTLTYGDDSDTDQDEEQEEDVSPVGWSDYRNKWLAQTGGLPSIYETVRDYQKKEAPNRQPRSKPDDAQIDPPIVMKQPDRQRQEIPKPIETKPPKELEPPSIPSISPSEGTPSGRASIVRLAAQTVEVSTEEASRKERKVSPFQLKNEMEGKDRPRKPAPPPPPPRRKNRKSLQLQSSPSLKQKQAVSKTKSFFWDITPKQSGTVWSELTFGELEASRLSMLENLFCNEDSNKKSKDVASPPPGISKKFGSTATLPVGRANNVSIMMTRFKHFSSIDEICKGVLTGEGLTDEELDLLAQIGPTEGEIKELRDQKDEDLSVPEKILVGMTCIPRLRVKASCQLAMRHWEDNYREAIDMLETIKRSCHQLKESRRLQRVLGAVLTVGNSMNRGTSRGNAGGIKIESLSRLWDTRVSGNAPSRQEETSTIQRAGSVPTAISQALEGPKVEEKITTLLDFTAVIVHDCDVAAGGGAIIEDYLLIELEYLTEAVRYLDDGAEDLLHSVDKGFDTLEREFRSITGKSWSVIDSNKLNDLKIKNGDKFVEEQRGFLIRSHQFLIQAGGARSFLKQEQSVMEQHLRSAVQWFGETNVENPKLHLKRILEFAKRFDASYSQLKTCMVSIAE